MKIFKKVLLGFLILIAVFVVYALAYMRFTSTRLFAHCRPKDPVAFAKKVTAHRKEVWARIVCDENGDCHHQGPDDPPNGFCTTTCSAYNYGFFCYYPDLCVNGFGLFPGSACHYCEYECGPGTEVYYCE
jgi:hypothetical protein